MVGLYEGQAYGSPWALVAETPFVERARAGEEKNIRLIKMHTEITLHMDTPCKLYGETRQCLVSKSNPCQSSHGALLLNHHQLIVDLLVHITKLDPIGRPGDIFNADFVHGPADQFTESAPQRQNLIA